MSLIVNFRPLVQRLGRYRSEIRRPLKVEMDSQARSFVSDPAKKTGMMQNTPPSHTGARGSKAKQHGERLVKAHIQRVVGTPGGLFARISEKSPEAAKGFWKAWKAGDLVKANAIARRVTGFYLREFDDGLAHKAARNERGRVGAKQRHVLYVTDPRWISKYIKEKQANVGLLAATFLHAGLKLGARGIPVWVQRHSTKISGTMTIHSGPHFYYLQLRGIALFAEADMQRRAEYAVQYRINALERRMPYIIRAVNKQVFSR